MWTTAAHRLQPKLAWSEGCQQSGAVSAFIKWTRRLSQQLRHDNGTTNTGIIIIRPHRWTNQDIVCAVDWTRVGPRKHYWMGLHIGATWQIRLNRSCATVIWPHVKLPRELVGYYYYEQTCAEVTHFDRRVEQVGRRRPRAVIGQGASVVRHAVEQNSARVVHQTTLHGRRVRRGHQYLLDQQSCVCMYVTHTLTHVLQVIII